MGLSEETQLAMTLGSLQSQVNTCVKTNNKIEDSQKEDKKELDAKIRVLEDAKLVVETKAGIIAFFVSTSIAIVYFLLDKFL